MCILAEIKLVWMQKVQKTFKKIVRAPFSSILVYCQFHNDWRQSRPALSAKLYTKGNWHTIYHSHNHQIYGRATGKPPQADDVKLAWKDISCLTNVSSSGIMRRAVSRVLQEHRVSISGGNMDNLTQSCTCYFIIN